MKDGEIVEGGMTEMVFRGAEEVVSCDGLKVWFPISVDGSGSAYQ